MRMYPIRYDLIELSVITSSGQGNSVRLLQLVQFEVQALLTPDTYITALQGAISLIFFAWARSESGTDGQKWICDNLLPHLLKIETLAEMFLDSEADMWMKEKLVQLMHKRKGSPGSKHVQLAYVGVPF
jgi:hypothetical protein